MAMVDAEHEYASVALASVKHVSVLSILPCPLKDFDPRCSRSTSCSCPLCTFDAFQCPCGVVLWRRWRETPGSSCDTSGPWHLFRRCGARKSLRYLIFDDFGTDHGVMRAWDPGRSTTWRLGAPMWCRQGCEGVRAEGPVASRGWCGALSAAGNMHECQDLDGFGCLGSQ